METEQRLDCWLDFPLPKSSWPFSVCPISVLNHRSFFWNATSLVESSTYCIHEVFSLFHVKCLWRGLQGLSPSFVFYQYVPSRHYAHVDCLLSSASQGQISAVALGLDPSLSYRCILKLYIYYYLVAVDREVHFTVLVVKKIINK